MAPCSVSQNGYGTEEGGERVETPWTLGTGATPSSGFLEAPTPLVATAGSASNVRGGGEEEEEEGG